MQAKRAAQSDGYTDELSQKRGAACQITGLRAEQQEARQGIQAKSSDNQRDQIRKYPEVHLPKKAKQFQIPHTQQPDYDGEADDMAGEQGRIGPERFSDPDRQRGRFKRCQQCGSPCEF